MTIEGVRVSADRTVGNRAPHLRKGTAVGAVLVLLLTVLAPQQIRIAEAAPEQTAGVTLDITTNRGMVGYTYVNNGQYDETTQVNNYVRYGLIQGKTTYSGAPEQSSAYQQFWVTGAQQAQNLWSYAARGGTDQYPAWPGSTIDVTKQSAIGFQANNLTTVEANTPFLIGTMRHNNNPIPGGYTWLHSQLYLDFNGVQEAFPFVQEETTNNTVSVVVARQGGNYSYVGQPGYGWGGVRTCDTGMILAQFNSSAGGYGCFVPSPGTGQYDLYTDSTSYAARYKVGSANQLPSSDDQVTINKVVSENIVISEDGVPYRLKIWGFYNNGNTQTCPSTPQGSQDETVTYFRTKEGQDTFGCLYGEFQQERYVTISKKVVADAHSQNVSVPAFSFHTDADAAADYFYSQGVVSDTSLFTSGVISGEHAGFINDGAFANTLRPTSAADPGGIDDYDRADGTQSRTDAYYAFGVGSSGFRIIENNPDTSANRTRSGWKLESISCVNGQGDDVAVGIDLNAGSVDFSHVGAASNPQAVPIRCTFTNRYEAKSRITLTKTVVGGGAQPGNWNLSATGATDDPVTKSTVVSGRANSAQVTSVVVPSGDYTLGESLNTTVYGYEFTDLICRDSSGRIITTRDADGNPANRAERLTLAPDAEVTCGFTNTFHTGRIALAKELTGSTEGFNADGRGFELTYTCTSGHSGSLTVQPGDPATLVSQEIPVGAECSVSEPDSAISGSRLKNSSYTWASPQYSEPVTVTRANTADNPATLMVTNAITQHTGILELAKTVRPDEGIAAGYTGGTSRTFPLSYTCTLDGQTVAQGTRDVVAGAQAQQVEVPAGATCTVTEPTPTVQAGDFSANYYEWSTTSYTGNDVRVGEGETKRITVTNTYTIATVPLTIQKVVVGPDGTQAEPGTTGYLASAADHGFVVNYTCGPTFGQVTVTDGSSVSVQVPRQTSCQIWEETSGLDEGTLNPDFDWDTSGIRYEDTAGRALVGQAVNVGTSGGTGVVVNPTKRSFGGIAIAKQVDDRSGLTSAARFGYHVVCYAPGVDATSPGTAPATFDQDVTIGLDEVWRMPENSLAAGSDCLVTETSPTVGSSDGFTNGSYVWTDTSWAIAYGQEHNNTSGQARSTVVTAHAKSTTDAEHPYPRVTFTNSFQRSYVTLQISKLLDLSEIDLSAIDSHTYSGGFHCDLGGQTTSGTWTQSRTGDPGEAGLANITVSTNQQNIPQTSPDTLTLFRGSWCQVTEDVPTIRPYAADAHYIWGAPVIQPGTVTWGDGDTNKKVTVTNTVEKTEANLLISKVVTGGEEGTHYAEGTQFHFDYTCWTDNTKQAKVVVNGVTAQGRRSITTGVTAELTDVTLPAGAYCELYENTDAKHGILMDPWIWDPVRYDNATPTGEVVTVGTDAATSVVTPVVSVTVPQDGSSVTVRAKNNLSNRLTEVKVSKEITGLTEGFTQDQEFIFNLACTATPGSLVAGYSGTLRATVPAGSTTASVSTGQVVPVGQHCQVTEVPVNGGLKDSSYAWDSPTYSEIAHGEQSTPATVTASLGNTAELRVTNPIKRVFGTVGLTKAIVGDGAAANQGRTATYSGTFTCSYDGQPVTTVGTGTWRVTGPGSATVNAADGTDLTTANTLLPLGSVCTAVETGIEGEPNPDDPQYRWKNGDGAPSYTAATVTPATRADMSVTNTVEQKRTPARITKTVLDEKGATTTRVLHDPSQPFSVTVQCAPTVDFDAQVTMSTELTTGQSHDLTVPAGWYCRATEVSPSNEWLKDASYRWIDPVITVSNADTQLSPVAGTGDVYRITDEITQLNVQVTNQVERATGPIALTKRLTPLASSAVKDPTKAFTGTYTCSYDGGVVSAGTWSSVPGQDATFTEDPSHAGDEWTPAALPLTSTCSFAEDAPAADALKNISWAWRTPVMDRGTEQSPVTVATTDGAPKVTVTNAVDAVYSTVTVVKDYDGTPEALTEGSTVGVQLICINPNTQAVISQRVDLDARGLRNASDDPSRAQAVIDGAVQTVNGQQISTVQIPAGSACTLAEDTLFTKLEKPQESQLVDTSWAWGEESYTSQLAGGQVIDQTGTWTAQTAADQVLTLTVTNHTHRVYGSLSVDKIVPDATTTATNTYRGRWTCTDEAGTLYEGSWSRSGAGSASLVSDQDYDGDGVNNIHVPVGSTCTVTETDRPNQPNADDPSFQWTVGVDQVPVEAVTNIVTPTTSKVATSASNARLQVTNDQVRHFGSFTITKQLEGATDGASTGEYWVNYTCSTRSSETVSGLVKLQAGSEHSVKIGDETITGDDIPVTDESGMIPVGANCFVQEMPPGSVVEGQTTPVNLTDPDSFTWRDTVTYYATNASGEVVGAPGTDNPDVPTNNPGYSFVLGTGETDATVINTVDPVAQVTKTFTGTTQHLDSDGAWDGTWDIGYTITVTNPSTTVSLAYGLKDTPSVPQGHSLSAMTVTGPGGAVDLSGQPLASGSPVTLASDVPEGAVLGAKGWVTSTGEVLMTIESLRRAGAELDANGAWTIADPGTATVRIDDGGVLHTADGVPIVVDPRAYLPASGTHTYTVVLNVTSAADGAAVLRPEQNACRAITPGDAVTTVHNQADVTSNKATRSSEDCGEIPESPSFAVAKVNSGVVANGDAIRNADGSYTASYDITVTNTSTTPSRIFEDLTDALTLPDSARLTRVVYTDTHPVDGTPAGTSQQLYPDRLGPWTLAQAGSGEVLAGGVRGADGAVTGGGSRTFHVTVTFTVDSSSVDFRDEEYQCGTMRGDGTIANGIFNLAAMVGDTDGPDNNSACQELNPQLNVKKELESSGGNTGAATFDVTYRITAENLGALAQDTGVLTDRPGFATGLTINSVKVARTVAELETAPVVTAQDGGYPVTSGVIVEPMAVGADGANIVGSNEQVFFIRFNVTLNTHTTGYDPALLECAVGEGGSLLDGHGLFNLVEVADSGKDWVPGDNDECAPVGPRMIQIRKTGTQINAQGTTDLTGAQFALFDVDPATTGSQPIVDGLSVDATNGALFTSSTLEIGRTYWLVETTAPAGHNLMPRPVAFRIGTTDDDKLLTTITLLDGAAVTGTAVSSTDATDSQMALITVTDTEIGTLPLAGGHGVTPYMMAALALIGSAVAMALTNKRRMRLAR